VRWLVHLKGAPKRLRRAVKGPGTVDQRSALEVQLRAEFCGFMVASNAGSRTTNRAEGKPEGRVQPGMAILLGTPSFLHQYAIGRKTKLNQEWPLLGGPLEQMAICWLACEQQGVVCYQGEVDTGGAARWMALVVYVYATAHHRSRGQLQLQSRRVEYGTPRRSGCSAGIREAILSLYKPPIAHSSAKEDQAGERASRKVFAN
jgi:hypothetical protein